MADKIDYKKNVTAGKKLEEKKKEGIDLNTFSDLGNSRVKSDVLDGLRAKVDEIEIVSNDKEIVQQMPSVIEIANQPLVDNKETKDTQTPHESIYQIEDGMDVLNASYINNVLSLKKAGGQYSKNLKKETFNITASPYFIAFFRHLSNIENTGIPKNSSQRMGVSTLVFKVIVESLFETGKMTELANEDPVLLHLLEQLKNDI